MTRMAAWTRRHLLSEQPETADKKARAKAATQASRAETRAETQAAQKEREREREQQQREKEKEREDRKKEREQDKAAQQQDEPQQQQPQDGEGDQKPPPMKILKPIPSPERAETDDKNYGLKKQKPEKKTFTRGEIIRRMFKARVDRMEHLKQVNMTSLDMALGLNAQPSGGQGLSSTYRAGSVRWAR